MFFIIFVIIVVNESIICFMLVRQEELTSLWYLFVIKYYDDNPMITSLVKSSWVYDTERGCEIIIRVPFSGYEECLNTYIGEFKHLLSRDSEFSSLLPVYFTYFRQNGTKVQAEEVPSQRNHFPSNMSWMFPELREDGLQNRAFRVFVKEEQSRLHCMISNHVLFPDELPVRVEKCKKSFERLVEESDKVSENGPSFDRADHLLSAVKKPLSKIEIELGTSSDSDYYKYAYNFVVTKYLDIILDSVIENPSLSGLNKASMKLEQFDSSILTNLTKECLERTKDVLLQLEQSTAYKQGAKEAEKASRLSARIKRFALESSSITSGGKRYTSPLLAWFSLIVLGFGSIVSLLEWIASLFTRKGHI